MKGIKKTLICMFTLVFAFVLFNVNMTYKIQALDVPTSVSVSYKAAQNNGAADLSETVTHNVIYENIEDSGIIDTTGHIELISPSSADSAYSKFYMQPVKKTETVVHNSLGANKNQKESKDYDLIITGWKLKSVKYNGNIYTAYNSDVKITKTIGTVYAQAGWLNIQAGIEAFEFEAVYGKAIYVKSPFETMYYNKFQIFKEGVKASGSSDDNFGTSPADAVSTFRRAYELINASTELTVYDNILVLCGRQYEVHRYNEKSSGVTNYDYTSLNAQYQRGTYQNYYYSRSTYNRINTNTGVISSGTSSLQCIFGYNSSKDKPATITSIQGTKQELVLHATRYDFYVFASLRFDNVKIRGLKSSENESSTTPKGFQLNFGNNINQTFETTENLETPYSTTGTEIRMVNIKKITINGGCWRLCLNQSFGGLSTIEPKATTSLEGIIDVKLRYQDRGEIIVGGKAHLGYIILGISANPSSKGAHLSILNMHSITVNGGVVEQINATGRILGSNVGSFKLVDGQLVADTTKTEDIHIDINGGYVKTIYGAYSGSLNGDINLDINGGIFDSIYCGGKSYTAEVIGNVNLNIDNAKVNHNIFGGGLGGLIDGSVDMNISNTTVKGNIYGSGKGTVDRFEQTLITATGSPGSVAKNTFKTFAKNYIYDGSTTENIYYYMDDPNGNPLATAPTGFPYYNPKTNEYITRVYHSINQSTDNSYVRLTAIKQKLTLSEVTKDVNITLNNVSANNLYGGGSIATVNGDINILITGKSQIKNVYGACDGTEKISNVTLYAPLDQSTYTEYEFPESGTVLNSKSDNNPTIGSFELIYDEDVLELGGIYDGKNKVIYNLDGTKTSFASYTNQTLITTLTSRYGTRQILFVANSGDFADVKGSVKVVIDCDPIYDSSSNQIYNITSLVGGNNSAGEVLGSSGEVNVTHSELVGYAGSNVIVNLKDGYVGILYGGSNKSACNYVSNVLIENGIVETLYGGCNQAEILGTAVEIKGGKVNTSAFAGNNTSGNINGPARIVVSGPADIRTIYGGSNAANGTFDSYTYVEDGTIKNIFGGSNKADINGTFVNVTGGSVYNLFGGNNNTGNIASKSQVVIDNNPIIINLYGGGNEAGNKYDTIINIFDGTIHNFYGGGLNGEINDSNILISNGTIKNAAYGGGYAGSAGNISLTIDGGSIEKTLYGGGYKGYTESAKIEISNGTISENIYGGGNAGETGSTEVYINGGTVNGYIYGAGYGATSYTENTYIEINTNVNTIYGGGYAGDAGTTNLIINSGTVSGTIYGGGYQGKTTDASVKLNGGHITQDIYGGGFQGETELTSLNINSGSLDGTIYGAGYGGTSETGDIVIEVSTDINDIYGGGYAGSAGTVELNISSNTVNGIIYGGGYEGPTNKSTVILNDVHATSDIYGGGNAGDTNEVILKVIGGTVDGTIYGAGLGATSHTELIDITVASNASAIYGGGNAGTAGDIKLVINKGNIKNNVYGGGYVGTANSTNITIDDSNNLGLIHIEGSVFGGGEGAKASVKEGTSVYVNLGLKLSVNEQLEDVSDNSGIAKVEVTPNGSYSKIDGSIYGGGDLGQVGKGAINAVDNTAQIDYESSVSVTVENGYIGGSVFGGGNGVPSDPSTYTVNMGAIFGSTETIILGGYIQGNVYGGGKQSRLYSTGDATNVQIIQNTTADTIAIKGSVFGGGDRGSATATNASVPTTIGNAYVTIENNTSDPSQIYFESGGVYGDGNFCLVSGKKYITMTNFTTNVQGKLKTFFSLQRADVVTLNNTDIVLKGAKDLVDEEDEDLYSINRVKKIYFKNGSTIKLVNIVKYLESIESDFYGYYIDENGSKIYYDKRVFINDGYNGTNGYNVGNEVEPLRFDEVQAYHAGYDSDLLNFICVANGLFLEMKQELGGYGNVIGLFGLELLRANEGEGGGFVYANIVTSTGDFVCNTKLTDDPVEFMNVVDNVGGLNSTTHKYKYYYWYIEGSVINYDFSITGYIGSEEPKYFAESVIPTTDYTIHYVLKSVTSTRIQELLDAGIYTLTDDPTSLSGKEIALEICIGNSSLGFLTYDTDGLKISGRTGYGSDQQKVSENILENLYVTNDNNVLYINLYKSAEVNTEKKNIDVQVTLELFESRMDGGAIVFDKYNKTSKLDFEIYFSIVRFVPVETVYSAVSKLYTGPSGIEGISITGKSAFTLEYQTKYIPGAFPLVDNNVNTMKWMLSTYCYEYYFEKNTGNYLTVRVNTDGTRTIVNKPNELTVDIDDNLDDNKRYYFVVDGVKYHFTMAERQDSSYLPKGTQITLVDFTNKSTPSYFYYTCGTNIDTINLLDFTQMGSTKTLNEIISDTNDENDPAFIRFYKNSELTRITERLIFVFDFNEAEWDVTGDFSGFVTLEHIYNAKSDILDYVFSNEEVVDGVINVTYNRVTPKSEKFNVNTVSTGIGNFEANFDETSYEEKEEAKLTINIDQEAAYINTQIVPGRMGVIISLKSGEKLPDGIIFVYNDKFYPAFGNTHIAIPLEAYGEHTISITNLLGTIGQVEDIYNRFYVNLEIELCNLPDDRYYSGIDFTTSANITDSTVEVITRKDYSIKVDCDNRVIGDNNQITFDVTTNITTDVYVEAYYLGEKVNLRDVFLINTYSEIVTNGSYTWTLKNDLESGIYMLKFTCKTEEECLTFIVP